MGGLGPYTVVGAFYWDNSPEGNDFWENVSVEFRNWFYDRVKSKDCDKEERV